MNDDGLLLNFTTTNTQLTPRKLAKLTGKKPKGSWRDRREAYAQERNNHVEARQERPQPIKHDSTFSKESGPSRVTKRPVIKPLAKGEQGIVSSLFTFNPNGSTDRHDSLKEVQSSSAQAIGSEHENSSNEKSKEMPLTESTKSTEMSIDKTLSNAPLRDQSSFNVNPKLAEFLKLKLNLNAPTWVQAHAVPAILEAKNGNNDVVMVAQTGSGKTLGYLIPIIEYLMSQHLEHNQRITRQSGVMAVIMAPTRELASQIYSVCLKLCNACSYIVPGLVCGGEKRKSEKARLRKGVNILIGTPGRMADHVENTLNLSFHKLAFFVLDEGDRLIDLGFEETLRKVLDAMPKYRTTVLCSATMNAQTSRLKSLALTEPVIEIREEKELENTPTQLHQRTVLTPPKLRLVTLAALIKQISKKSQRGIVFFSCMDSVDFHYYVFQKFSNAKVFKLHGNMSQQERTKTISELTACQDTKGVLLFTTDVASRGLDLVVNEVIEYDPPFSIEDHLHRAGRTARAGLKGQATMFLLPTEEKYQERLSKVHPNGIDAQSCQSQLQKGFGRSKWQDEATAWQLEVEKDIIENPEESGKLAKNAFTASIRAYTTHPHSERDIFNFRNLHLGHLAKAFALRETPTNITGPNQQETKPKKSKSTRQAFLDAAQKHMSVGDFNVV